MPKLLGFQNWFEARFRDLCEAHDRAYVLRSPSKWAADAALFRGLWGRGYRTLAVAAYLMCLGPAGWWFWVRD